MVTATQQCPVTGFGPGSVSQENVAYASLRFSARAAPLPPCSG
jgi:hypothetical protein